MRNPAPLCFVFCCWFVNTFLVVNSISDIQLCLRKNKGKKWTEDKTHNKNTVDISCLTISVSTVVYDAFHGFISGRFLKFLWLLFILFLLTLIYLALSINATMLTVILFVYYREWFYLTLYSKVTIAQYINTPLHFKFLHCKWYLRRRRRTLDESQILPWIMLFMDIIIPERHLNYLFVLYLCCASPSKFRIVKR